ncbi:MAG: SLC13 family permease, partial [Stackebrandtia sp.]
RVPPHKWIGLGLGPVLAATTYFLLALDGDANLTQPGRVVAAVAVLMAVWWMTEAIPLAVTALLPIVAFPLLSAYTLSTQAENATVLTIYGEEEAVDADAVASEGLGAGMDMVVEAAAPYANPLVFLFMGGFMIALAMQKWNLHKRIALAIVRFVGTTPKMLVLGMMIATAFLSLWVSNTATTLMMLPIAISVLAVLGDDGEGGTADKAARAKFSVALLLAIAYAASIGGLGTIVGSPPNVFMVAHMNDVYDVNISFVQWMMLGVPLAAVFLIVTWLVLTRVLFNTGDVSLGGSREVIRSESAKLGPMSRGEWTVLAVFVAAALLWVSKEGFVALSFLSQLETSWDTVVAMAAGIALFLIPVSVRKGKFALDWKTVQTGMPWGVLLLFGGGLSLAAAISGTGLATYIGEKFSGWDTVALVVLIGAVAAVVLFLTELTSNTATANTFVPIVAAVGLSINGDAGATMLGMTAALAASCAFMLPVATPPNAIVFGTGRVGIVQMIRAGLLLNVAGLVLVTAAVYLLAGAVFGV